MNIERKKCKYGASPCKCLCDTLHEKNVIGSGENKERVFLFVVHNFLNVRQEIGHSLHFVKNSAIRELPQKRAGVTFRKSARVRIFQRAVWLVREKHLYKCSLAGLSRSCYRDNRIITESGHDGGFYLSSYFHAPYYSIDMLFMQYGKLATRIT